MRPIPNILVFLAASTLLYGCRTTTRTFPPKRVQVEALQEVGLGPEILRIEARKGGRETSSGPSVMVEMRVIIYGPRGETLLGFITDLSEAIIDADAAKALVRRVKESPDAEIVMPPGVVLLSGNRGFVRIDRSQAYIAEYSLSEGIASNPKTRVLTTGFAMAVLPQVQGDAVMLTELDLVRCTGSLHRESFSGDPAGKPEAGGTIEMQIPKCELLSYSLPPDKPVSLEGGRAFVVGFDQFKQRVQRGALPVANLGGPEPERIHVLAPTKRIMLLVTVQLVPETPTLE